MRFLSVVVLLVSTSSVATGRQPEDDLSAATVEVLAQAFRDGRPSGSSIRLGKNTVALRVTVERVVRKDDKVIVALDVQCAMDGVAPDVLHAGSIGVDDSETSATKTAIAEWVMQYGVPLGEALGAKLKGKLGKDPKRLSIGRFEFYPGPTGLRGVAKDDPVAKAIGLELHRTILGRLRSTLEGGTSLSKGALHTITLLSQIRNGGFIEGECRLDGQVSKRICDLISDVAWPKGPGGYLFKQYYVFRAAAP